MLVDDDLDDLFIHEREITKLSAEIIIVSKDSGKGALEYLKSGEYTTVTALILYF
jgi:hypothetical protein